MRIGQNQSYQNSAAGMHFRNQYKQLVSKRKSMQDYTPITAKPTEDQLKSIEESMARESEYIKDSDQIVPIDWDYVKETINLTPEQREAREAQDRRALDEKWLADMAAIEEEWAQGRDKIDAMSEKNEKQEEKKNKAKAMGIAARIASGDMVSGFDIAFLNDVAPEKLVAAQEKNRQRIKRSEDEENKKKIIQEKILSLSKAKTNTKDHIDLQW